MAYEVPYATSSVILDCSKSQNNTYSPAFFSNQASCGGKYSDCDDRSYSAYALP